MKYKLCVAFITGIRLSNGSLMFQAIGIHPSKETLEKQFGDNVFYIETLTNLENLEQIKEYTVAMLEIEEETMQ